MRYFVITSDKHSFLLDGYTELFNTFWDDSIQVEILGFDEPKVELPDNFSFISLGKQSDFSTWSGPLIPFFESLEDEEFFVCFEDHFPVQHVRKDLFEEGLKYIQEDKTIDKVYLTLDPRAQDYHYNGNYFMAKDVVNIRVNSSLLPSIWKTETFLKMLKVGCRTPHEFEGKHNDIQVGLKVILTEQVIYPNIDCMRAGRFNRPVVDRRIHLRGYDYGLYTQQFSPESIQVFYRMASLYTGL